MRPASMDGSTTLSRAGTGEPLQPPKPGSALPDRPSSALPASHRSVTSPSISASAASSGPNTADNSFSSSHPRLAADAFSGRVSGKFQQLSSSLSIKISDKLKLRRRSANLDTDAPTGPGPSVVGHNGISPAVTPPTLPSHAAHLPVSTGHSNSQMMVLSGGYSHGGDASRGGSDIEEFDPPLHPFRNPFSLVTTPLTKIMRLPRRETAPNPDGGHRHVEHGRSAGGSSGGAGPLSPSGSMHLRVPGGEAASKWMKRFVPRGASRVPGVGFPRTSAAAAAAALAAQAAAAHAADEAASAGFQRASGHSASRTAGAGPNAQSWPEFEGSPPMGYLWLWLGNLRRWQRRFFVASDTPGVLLFYKRMNMKGKVSSISLRSTTVEVDDVNNRQLQLNTLAGTIFLRVMRPEDRANWLDCLRQSLAVFAQHQNMVDDLKDKGMIPEGPAAQQVTFANGLPVPLNLSRLSASLVPPEAVADLDAEQRKRIRVRVSERLGEIWPFEQELERHLACMRQQLLTVVSGLNVHMPMMTPSSSIMGRLSSVAPASAAAAAAALAAPDAATPGLPGASSLSHEAEGAMGEPHLVGSSSAPTLGSAGVLGGGGRGAPGGRASLGPDQHALPALVASARAKVVVKAASLTQAHGNLLDAVRATLQNDAMRIVQLEAENAALLRSFNILKARHPLDGVGSVSQSRRAGRSSQPSSGGTPQPSLQPPLASSGGSGLPSSRLVTSTLVAAAADALSLEEAEGSTSGSGEEDDDDDDDACSVQTADEDAFAIDEGGGGQDVDGGDLRPEGASDSEADEEDEEEEEEERSQQAAVLTALEVVRQVDYVSRDRAIKPFIGGVAPGGTAATGGSGSAAAPPPPQGDEEHEEQNEDDSVHEDDEGSDHGWRARLPAPKPLGKGFSIWSILKNMIGRDLTKITMPATINEPLSVLQRLTEILEYYPLVDRALTCTTSSAERMVWVAAWVATSYNCQPFRLGKPFNPLLGETYEWHSVDGSCRFLGEQVCHHPPVSCIWAEGAGGDWSVHGEVETRTKFWGKSIELLLHGSEAVFLKPFGEEYRYNKANVCVQDIILGNYWVEVYGEVKIVNAQTGDVCKLTLKPCRGRLADRGKVEGCVMNAQGHKLYRISGSTSDKLYGELTKEGAAARLAAGLPVASAASGSVGGAPPASFTSPGTPSVAIPIGLEPVLLWQKMEYPEDPVEQYMFTKFAIGINDPAVHYASQLAPTDARFRPDQKAMELGDWGRATSEKLRLEAKQRQARGDRKLAGEEWTPRWFQYQSPPGVKDLTNLADQPGFSWAFNGDYWRRQTTLNWDGCADLY